MAVCIAEGAMFKTVMILSSEIASHAISNDFDGAPETKRMMESLDSNGGSINKKDLVSYALWNKELKTLCEKFVQHVYKYKHIKVSGIPKLVDSGRLVSMELMVTVDDTRAINVFKLKHPDEYFLLKTYFPGL